MTIIVSTPIAPWTYETLESKVASWLHRADLTDQIPDFIMLAEKRINGDLDARLQDTAVMLTTVANTQSIVLPSDLLSLRSLTLISSPNIVLDYLTPDQFNTQYSSAAAQRPQSFAIIGDSAYLGPTPDSVYSVQCIYKAAVPALSLGSNWLIASAPNVYLMATLCEAARYMANDERIPVWEAAYAEAIASVNKPDWYSGSTMRVRSDVRM